jgi:hypothetical protein
MKNSNANIGCVVVSFFLLSLLSFVIFGGCYGLSCATYSEGYRDGTIQKVSDSGIIFKTTESEMVLGGMVMEEGNASGTFNREKFYFTVSDPEVKNQIVQLKTGQKVRLHYVQTLVHWHPRGNTCYFATSVEILK